MPTFTDDDTAILALETRLRSRFTDSVDGYGANYSRYRGVDVVSVQDEPTEERRVGKPHLLLEQTDGSADDEWSSADDAFRNVTVRITAVANDSSGALQAEGANPVTSDRQLSKDLQREFLENGVAWDDLGIYDIECRPQTEVITDTVHKIPHSVSFKYEVS